MAVLVTCTATDSGGDVLDAHTCVGNLAEVAAVEQRFQMLGTWVAIRFDFDPPLIVPAPSP